MATETKSTTDLVREAVDEARDLIRAEVRLATAEAKIELEQTKAAVVTFGVAGAIGFIGSTLLAVAIPLAFARPAIAALVTGGVFLVLAGGIALAAYIVMPKKPMKMTRETTQHELTKLEEAL